MLSEAIHAGVIWNETIIYSLWLPPGVLRTYAWGYCCTYSQCLQLSLQTAVFSSPVLKITLSLLKLDGFSFHLRLQPSLVLLTMPQSSMHVSSHFQTIPHPCVPYPQRLHLSPLPVDFSISLLNFFLLLLNLSILLVELGILPLELGILLLELGIPLLKLAISLLQPSPALLIVIRDEKATMHAVQSIILFKSKLANSVATLQNYMNITRTRSAYANITKLDAISIHT